MRLRVPIGTMFLRRVWIPLFVRTRVAKQNSTSVAGCWSSHYPIRDTNMLCRCMYRGGVRGTGVDALILCNIPVHGKGLKVRRKKKKKLLLGLDSARILVVQHSTAQHSKRILFFFPITLLKNVWKRRLQGLQNRRNVDESEWLLEYLLPQSLTMTRRARSMGAS